MNPLNLVVIILFPLAVFLIVIGLGQRSKTKNLERSAQKKIGGEDLGDPASQQIKALEKSLAKVGLTNQLQNIIDQSYLRMSPGIFILACLGIFTVIYLSLWGYLKINSLVNILFSLSSTVLGAWSFIKNRRNFYNDEMVKQMPQVAIILSNALKAGMTVTQAINLVSQRVSWPAKDEFNHVSHEISLGLSVEEALQHLATRVKIKEIHTVVATISVLRQSGGNLSQALSLMANAIMGRERVRAEIRTVTSEARYTGMALLVLPLLMLLMINSTQPGSVARFLDRPVGVVIMILFIGVQFAAYIMINKFAEIDL